tara:strand:- start:483 stop:839 length:357 start_codon:yes stop_codon:yes gene_type:complete
LHALRAQYAPEVFKAIEETQRSRRWLEEGSHARRFFAHVGSMCFAIAHVVFQYGGLAAVAGFQRRYLAGVAVETEQVGVRVFKHQGRIDRCFRQQCRANVSNKQGAIELKQLRDPGNT